MSTFTATTRSRSRSPYSENNPAESTVNPPDYLFSSYSEEFHIRELEEWENGEEERIIEIDVAMHPVVFSYIIRCEFEDGKEYINEARGALSGMAGTVNLSNRRTLDDVVTVLAEEVDLSAVQITDLKQVEEAMEKLPGVKKVVLGLCGTEDDPAWGNSKAKDIAVLNISNEDMAAYRDRVRDQYKVAWTVRVGPNIALRTDVDNFMPGHFNTGRLFTDHAYNLRYCEDMVTLDIGHMTLQNIDFVAFMPKLRHLILAWTEVQYIEPIRNCKELVFLELDNSVIRDYSPLVDCTALEDLNIGNTDRKIDPILEMTWLKNLWMVKCGGGNVYKAKEALTGTNVVTGGSITVGNGWRKLQNYYDMRDNLGVPYMKG